MSSEHPHRTIALITFASIVIVALVLVIIGTRDHAQRQAIDTELQDLHNEQYTLMQERIRAQNNIPDNTIVIDGVDPVLLQAYQNHLDSRGSTQEVMDFVSALTLVNE